VTEPDVEELLDELYATEPQAFISTRERIVRELRAAGHREQAATVARCRRPTAAADAANRIARTDPDGLRALVSIGARLRDAHVTAVRDPAARDDLRRLQRDRRVLTEQLAAKAPAHHEDVARAFAAAAVDGDVAAIVLAGRLERIPEPVSGLDTLGSALGDLPAPIASETRSRARDDARRARARDTEQAALTEARAASAEVERLRAELRAAERRAQQATRRADHATAELRALDDG
jgi:hypothetical protein